MREEEIRLENELRIFKIQNRRRAKINPRRAKLDEFFVKQDKLKQPNTKLIRRVSDIMDTVTFFSLSIVLLFTLFNQL